MTSSVEPPEPPTLTKRLKAAGKELHTISDALVNARLVALFTSRELYGKALGCFYHVHKQLDSALQGSGDKTIIKLQAVLRPLYRTEAYERDLQYYLGPDWRERVPVTAPIKAYQDHLEQLARSQPLLLLAHSHSQHLAMLSGGQIIRGLARKGMGLPEGEGTAAFEYQGKVADIRSAYMDALDEEGNHMNEATIQQLLYEKKVSFQMNNHIIRSFRMGYLAPLRAAARLMPSMVWLVLAATLALTAALAVAARSGQVV